MHLKIESDLHDLIAQPGADDGGGRSAAARCPETDARMMGRNTLLD
jgi:hypothetical protein